MPTIVAEDGTGIPTANSYATVVDADAYADLMGDDAFLNATLQQKEAALIQATIYLDSNFQWAGEISNNDQGLSWPRLNVIDSEGRYIAADVVPARVRDADCLLAGKAISGSLQPDVETTVSAGGAIKRKKVASIEIEYADPGTTVEASRRFPEVEAMLRSLTMGSPSDSSGSLLRWS